MKQSILVLALCAVAVGCGKTTPTVQKQVPAVETMVASLSETVSSPTEIGVVEESQSLSLSFRTSGNVSAVYVKEGATVSKGQLLAELDKETLQSAYDAAESTLSQAEDALNRMEKLHESGALPDIQWVEVQSKVQSARSVEIMARKALEAAELKAPMAGLILQRSIETGENVMPGVGVFKLVNIDQVDVLFSVSEDVVSSISDGDAVSVTLKSTGETFQGKVWGRKLKSDALSHTYDVRVRVSNAGHKLLPGMICRAQLGGTTSEKSITVPQEAVLLNSDNSRFVWTVSDGKAVLTPVTIGGFVPGGVKVLSGLSEGSLVVVKGMQKISEGMTVKSTVR